MRSAASCIHPLQFNEEPVGVLYLTGSYRFTVVADISKEF
jgi:hypothetical protein